MRLRLTAADLRDIIGEEISFSIDGHRASREFADKDYTAPVGPPTDQEITDFIRTNPFFDFETIDFLTSHHFLGFEARYDSVRAEWIEEFRENVAGWADNESWLAADLLDVEALISPKPVESEIWFPESHPVQPGWIEQSPTALVIAADFLKNGRLLSELHWRDFEKLLATLLERSGWIVELTRGSKDGGIDVIAMKNDSKIGAIKSLWQAKKYHSKNKVQLRDARELSAVREEQKATKAVIVTTSHLTKGALDWIRKDKFRLDYKEKDDVEKWVLNSIT
jgi:hypothetical protein